MFRPLFCLPKKATYTGGYRARPGKTCFRNMTPDETIEISLTTRTFRTSAKDGRRGENVCSTNPETRPKVTIMRPNTNQDKRRADTKRSFQTQGGHNEKQHTIPRQQIDHPARQEWKDVCRKEQQAHQEPFFF